MKIAYLILAHKNPEQLKRLISVLHCEDAVFFIHVDKRSNVEEFHEVIKESDVKNINFIQSQSVKWGSISQTEARIKLIEYALNSNKDFSHFVMLSGQTYLIKPLEKFISFLKSNPDTTFIEHYPLPYHRLANSGIDRTECYTYSILGKRVTYLPHNFHNTFNFKGKLLNLLLFLFHIFRKKRTFPVYCKAYYGIDWWVLTKKASSYIIDFIQKHPDYHAYHKYTRHTSEVYFPSILAGGGFDGQLDNRSLHLMVWPSYSSSHPKILTYDDFNQIQNSEAFFARKFDVKVDSRIFELIDKQLLKNKDE